MRVVLALAAAVVAAPAVRGAELPVFNTYAPGNGYDPFTGWTVSGPGSFVGSFYATGLLFTPSSSGALSSIELSIQRYGGTNAAILYLHAVSGGTTGALLESWALAGLPANGTSGPPTSVASIVKPELTAGTSYILFAAPGAADTWAAWCQNSLGMMGDLYNSNAAPGTGGTVTGNMLLPAVRINVLAAVPEPSSVALVGAAAGALMIARRRRPL